MWQIDFYTAMQRERERLRELEQQRRLADALRTGGPATVVPRWRRGIGRALVRGRQLVGSIGHALDVPAIGPHHL